MDSAVARRNFLIYSGLSTALFAISISSLINEKPNFYALLITISHGGHAIIFCNFLIVLFILIGKLLQTVLFGELRLIEREHVYERSWFTMMNLLMAVAIFRDENNLLIGFLILNLLFLKIFHWILVDRIQYIFQIHETIRGIIFTRASLTLILFLFLDYKMIWNCIENSFHGSPDVYVIFGFDFALLFFDLFEEFGKLILNLTEIWYLNRHENDDVWEFKTISMKIFEISISFVKFITIFFNFFILIGPYRMPITVMRESYLTISKFIGQVSDLIRYRRASRELDTKLQNATQLDLDHDDTCIICRDEMSIELAKSTRLYPKKLNCGHVIHLGCLKSWMERSESCPMCRSPVFTTNPLQQNATATPTDQSAVAAAPQQQQQQQQQGNDNAGAAVVEDGGQQIPPQPVRYNLLERMFHRTHVEAEQEPQERQNINNHQQDLNGFTENGDHRANNEESNETNSDTPMTNDLTMYHPPSITIPSNSLVLPPEWLIFPLLPLPQNDPLQPGVTSEYEVYFNPNHRANLKIVEQRDVMLDLIPFPLRVSSTTKGSNSSGNDIREERTETLE